MPDAMGGCARGHVVMVPLPLQGHISSMISLAQYLAESGIMVTLVHTARSHTLLASAFSDSLSSKEQVRIEVIPDGLPSDYKKSMEQMRDGAALPLMRTGLEELLRKLMQDGASHVLPPPCCLILDSFLSWGHDVALTFHLPRIVLWTCSATMFSIGFHFPHIIAKGLIPATKPGSLENVVDFIPGVPPIRIVEMLGSVMPQEGLQNPALQFFVSSFEHSKDADRILANTIDELESSIVDALRKEAGIPIHPIGPMFMINSSSKQPASLLHEDTSCLSWLDQQQESSVLYISFGSMVFLDDNVLTELAYGLEASNEKFIWVIRPDAFAEKASMEELLPVGFMERTHERGRVIAWAPQVAVLSHSSVGAFLTHCGWNSVMESLSKGVPMLCFPQQADQMTNCKCVVHDWKAGLPLLDDHAGKIMERSHVQRAMNGIMRGQEAMHARKRARAWRHIAPSHSNLEKLVNDIKLWSAHPSKTK